MRYSILRLQHYVLVKELSLGFGSLCLLLKAPDATGLRRLEFHPSGRVLFNNSRLFFSEIIAGEIIAKSPYED